MGKTLINNLVEFYEAGEALLTRDNVYVSSVDGKAYKLDVTDPDKRVFSGIAKDTVAMGEFVRVVQSGKIKGFTGLNAGEVVYASTTVPGSFQLNQPASAAETVIIGTAKSGSDLIVNASLGVPFATGGEGGVGGVDILAVQDFDNQNLGEFTQVGLTFETVAPLKGVASAKLVHDDTINQSFKQVIPVDRKFRGKTVSLKLDIKSAASAGNVTLTVVDETNTVTLVNSEQLPISNEVGGTVGIVSFLVPDTCESLSYEVVALPEAGLPETLVDDVILEIPENPIQAATVQEEDSVLYAAGNAGQVITANVTNIPFNLVSNKGDDIVWNGDSFSVTEDGIYSISVGLNFTAGVGGYMSVYEDGVIKQSLGDATTTSLFTGNLSTNLIGGKIYSIRFTSNATLANNGAAHHLTITKQNSIKQVNVNPNSKITIPTSELRMEGANSRGSVDTGIVRFDNVAKLRGDAFEVISTVENGTKIVMKKKGRLDVSSSLALAAINAVLAISKNQSGLTVAPTVPSEIMAMTQVYAGTAIDSLSACFDVNVGDVIRISANSAVTSGNQNQLNLSFQEQDIAVSVTNVLPQFSESDSSIRLDTANGYGSVGNKIRRFANVRDNIGTDIEYIDSATDGASFVIKSDGIYEINYSGSQDGINQAIGISLNSVNLTTDILTLPVLERLSNQYLGATAGEDANCSWQGYLRVGDVIRPHTGGVVNSVRAERENFTISKVGKPNVTGVDVTPFVNIPQPDSQSEIINFNNVRLNQTTDIASFIPTLTKGSGIYEKGTFGIRMLKAGKIDVNLSFTITNDRASSVIYLNGQTVALGGGQTTLTFDPHATFSGNLNAGDVVTFATTGSNALNTGRLSVRATALSDQILTAPESFSSDTANLTYAPSSLYTLSTLKDAPVGTFITFTYAANSNTRTQTTTPPTQTTADMNLNGLRIFTRPFNQASNAAQPSTFAIQIGKGFKGKTIDLYKGVGKDIAGSIDYIQTSSGQDGLRTKEYNEDTGVLILDAGQNRDSIITSALLYFSDGTAANNGYLVINASKSPLKLGFGIASDTSAKLGLDPDKFITPKTLRSGLNASGEAPVYACRAWVNFNGTGTVAIRESGNVSSITDLGTGRYRVNFEKPMEDTNYVVLSSNPVAGDGTKGSCGLNGGYDGLPVGLLTTSVEIRTGNTANLTFADHTHVHISIVR